MAEAPATILKIVFDARDRERFFLDAFVDEERRLDLSGIRGKPSFRGICIALLVARILGRVGDQKMTRMEVNALSDTWISTVTGTRMESDPYWFETHFKTRKLFNALRGNPPRVEYLHHSLLLDNLSFHYGIRGKKVFGPPLTKDEMISLAQELDDGGIWDIGCVDELLGIEKVSFDLPPTELQSGPSIEKFDGKAKNLSHVASKAYEESSEFTKLANELCFHIRRSGGQRTAIDKLRSESGRHPTLKNTPMTKYGDTPLMLAIAFKKQYVIDFLLEFPGVDLSCKNRLGNTPALKAASLNDFVTIGGLDCFKADMTSSNCQRANGIYEACFGATDEALNIIRRFDLKGVSRAQVCLNGSDPLDIAIARNAPEALIESLRSHKLHQHKGSSEKSVGLKDDVLVRIYDGFRRGNYAKAVDLIFNAFSQGQTACDKSAKLDLNLLPRKWPTPLFRAMWENDVELVQRMVTAEKDKQVLFKDDEIYECPPLHFAAERGLSEIIRVLLAAGADPLVQNRYGRTARDVLPVKLSAHHLDALQKLKEAEADRIKFQFERENVVGSDS